MPKGLDAWQGTEASRPASAVEASTIRAGEASGAGSNEQEVTEAIRCVSTSNKQKDVVGDYFQLWRHI
ncbi:hypothetical protein EYF80_000639 [Liparis tanakae]|uniref:Uncharacterized protein n=1 Tax=Liparis tanakae TaxID=230148 RepID=A0A4Z2JHC0_9TELE|nr:hypothetical protein EYF80_000639 [Liparis tanakae]